MQRFGVQIYAITPLKYLPVPVQIFFSEKGELAELIPDGKKRFNLISTAREKLKDSISLYVTGSHNTVSPQMMEKYFFVSMKGMADYGLVSKPLQDQGFQESIRNIAEQPSVIVHVAETDDGNTKEVNLAFIRPVHIIVN